LRIGGEAAADQFLSLGFVSHSIERGEENSDILSPRISHQQGWRQSYFSAMTYVTARVDRRLYTPLVIKTLLPPEEL
jgi:hypothetical protein